MQDGRVRNRHFFQLRGMRFHHTAGTVRERVLEQLRENGVNTRAEYRRLLNEEP